MRKEKEKQKEDENEKENEPYTLSAKSVLLRILYQRRYSSTYLGTYLILLLVGVRSTLCVHQYTRTLEKHIKILDIQFALLYFVQV
jgi:hypothetical protein